MPEQEKHGWLIVFPDGFHITFVHFVLTKSDMGLFERPALLARFKFCSIRKVRAGVLIVHADNHHMSFR